LIRRRRVLGEKGIADGHTSEVQADDPWAGGTQGVDHLQTSSAQIDVEAGTGAAGKVPGRKGDEPAFLVAAEKLYRDTEDLGGRKKEGFGVFGPAKSAGGDGNGSVGSKGQNFSLKLGQNPQGPLASGRL
jgi:hypothetical protein